MSAIYHSRILRHKTIKTNNMQYCKSVTLRMRDRRNGTKSLFLDFWPGYRNPETMELIRRRSLGMYIYANPISTQQKKYNEAILAKAEAIRCKVFIEVINEKYDFFNQDRLKEDFLAYFKNIVNRNFAKCDAAYKHFSRFCHNKCTFEMLDTVFCNKYKEYLLLNLARNSIYHQLPELLFHPLVLSTPGMSNKEIVEAIRANEKQDKELIQFFAPFDTEFFKEKVRINNRHLNFFSDPDSKKNFIKMIEVMENVELSITSHQKYKLFLFLCNAERYKENLPAIEQLLLIVLGLKVKLRLEVHEIDETVYLSVGSGCVGQTLGLNGLMISETDDLTATIILDTPTDDYEEVKTHLSNVRRILEFFILSTRNIEVDYLVHGETDFILGENRLGYNMNL